MYNYFKIELARIRASAQETKRLPSLVGAAMLTALSAAINRFTISFTTTLRLSFGFLTVGLCGMLYGPVLAGMMGIGVDLLRYMMIGGGEFFLGFTLNEFLVGFLYGCFLYQKKITPQRVFFAKLTVTIVINLVLTPLWLSILYGDAFIVLLGARIIKNAIMLPVETLLLYIVCKKVSSLRFRQIYTTSV